MIRRAMGTMLLLLTIIVAALPGIASAERDPLANVVEMDAPQIRTVPPDLFTRQQQSSLTAIVNEARLFGVPLVVRAITVPTTLALLPEASVVSGASLNEQQIVQRMAEEWLAEEGVETSPGAGDGILLFIVVPEDDHTQSIAAFSTGPQALPLNGLTQATLDHVLTDIISPFFTNNTIAPGIHTGVAYLSYDNLFAVPARHDRTEQQETLHSLANTGLAGLTILASLGLVSLVFWIRRRHHDTDEPAPVVDSPFAAGALARGRVDASVVTSGLLHLIRIGAIEPHTRRSGELVLHIEKDAPVSEPFACQILRLLAGEADSSNKVHDAGMRRIQDVLTPARDWLRDDLATRRLFNRDALVEMVWIILGSAAVAAFALLSLLPSMIAMSRLGIATIVLAATAIILALNWVMHRSWTTPAGKQALERWKASDLSNEDVAIFGSIIHQDVLLDAPGGPEVPPSIRMVRELRGLGAG